MKFSNIQEIIFSKALYQQIIQHALRKINAQYLENEYHEQKAYGLIGGKIEGNAVYVVGIYLLKRSVRSNKNHKEKMDKQMQDYAVPSVTPLEKRGWIADSDEVWEAVSQFSEKDGFLFGNYHTHRIAWEHDPIRDTCTKIDRELAKGAGQWVFIISVVNPEKPIVRAFYEGVNEKEATIIIKD